MNQENTTGNGPTSGRDTLVSTAEEVRRLREENERLTKENAELRFERDIYYRSVMEWAKIKFASEPLPPIPAEDECQDIRVLLDELERETTEQ
jgi:hypothetical protein